MEKVEDIIGEVSFNFKDKLIFMWVTKSGILESVFIAVLISSATNIFALVKYFKSDKGNSEHLSQVIQNFYLGPIALFLIMYSLWFVISLCFHSNWSSKEKSVYWIINNEKITVKDATGKEQFLSWDNVERFKQFPSGFLFKIHRWNGFWIPERTFNKINSNKLSQLASNKMALFSK